MQSFWIFICYLLVSLSPILAQEDIIHPQQYWCYTADSLKLATDVYLPDKQGPFPTILIRTPYGKGQYGFYGQEFAAHGFAVVIQDVRGKWDSEGEFYPFVHETEDGLITLDFIKSQSWSNGSIGIFGESYPGFCGLTLTPSQHPSLKTVFSLSGWAEPSKMAMPGGASNILLNIPWQLNEYMQNTGHDVDFEMEDLFAYLPQKEVFRSIGVHIEAWERPTQLQEYNTDFDYNQIKIPIYHASGWYDFVGDGTLRAYINIDKSKSGPQHLVIGPWFHNQMETTLTDLNEIEFDENGIFGHEKIMENAISWFNRWLKGQPDSRWDEHRSTYYVLFENSWKESETWPPENIQFQKFHLDSKGNANTRFGDGRLINAPPANPGIDQFVFDPNQPVPTNGGANFHFFPDLLGIKDQSQLEERRDILVYTSDPFTEKRIVAGPLKVQLFAASDAPDTDFTAKLVLVDKEGKAWNMVDGIIRARYREGMETESLLEPGSINRYTIDLGQTAFAIDHGEQIRLEISSSNFPKYDRNANSSIHPFEAKVLNTSIQQIHHSETHPSFIRIPFLDYKE